ncbi:MAG TPA: LytTR family DNA-binding domain-containing protein [Longimicrobium sp.]|jgi:DNA-binding LytR/AlgR family response regulator
MNAGTLPHARLGSPVRSWRAAALIVGGWMLLGVLFLVEQGAVGQPALTGPTLFRRLVGPALGAALTPLGLHLARRYRVEAPHRLRHGLILAFGALGLTLASFTALYYVHRLAGTLGPVPLVSWLASTVHEGLLYCGVVLLIGHVLGARTPAAAPVGIATPPAASPPPARVAEHLSLKLRDRTVLVAPAEVAWIEADGHHVVFHLVGGARHTVRDTLRRLETALAPRGFVRVHRSTLVNVAQVKELRPWFAGDSLLYLKDGTELRLSRRYADHLLAPTLPAMEADPSETQSS